MREKKFKAVNAYRFDTQEQQVPEDKATAFNRWSYLTSAGLKELRDSNDEEAVTGDPAASQAASGPSQLTLERLHLPAVIESVKVLNKDLRQNGYAIEYQVVKRPAK